MFLRRSPTISLWILNPEQMVMFLRELQKPGKDLNEM